MNLVLGEHCESVWRGKTVECLEDNRVLCGSLDGKNVERNEDSGGPACQVSEGSRDSVENLCVIYLI